MLTACLFLLCICPTLLLSPVVIRYTKDTRTYLVVHFVFFSLTLVRKKTEESRNEEKKTEQDGSKQKKRARQRAIHRALRYAMPRATVSVQSLPTLSMSSPFLTGIGRGAYYFALSVPLSFFDRCTSDPLLRSKKTETATVDLRFRMRLYAFLHTFLIYLAQYRKEKEARKSHVRNENE